jgi:basic membrane protein A
MVRGILRWAVLLALPLLVMGGFTQVKAESFKVAIVLPGVITDKSFNQTVYEGILLAREKLGIEVAYSEKVPQADQAEAMADYARRGYNLIIGCGGEFQDAADRVASNFPDTMFMVVNGDTADKNLAIARFHNEGLAYVMGYIGGKMTESNIGAFIGGQQVQFSMLHLLGFENGFKAANPDSKVLVAWTNDWDDIAKGKEAALSVIAQGADMIYPTMDNAILGSYQAAKEQGKWAFGVYYDVYQDWPEIILQSAIMMWDGALVELISLAKDGKLEGKEYLIGFETPTATGLGSWGPSVPEEVRAATLQIIDDIISGKLDPAAK